LTQEYISKYYHGVQKKESIVSIILHQKGTSVELRHTNIPDEAYEDIVEGWNEVWLS